MTTLVNAEAALPGAASKAENGEEFQSNNNCSPSFSKPTSNFFSDCQTQEDDSIYQYPEQESVVGFKNLEDEGVQKVQKPLQEPNALYLTKSQYLRKEDRDPSLVRSPLMGGFLIPLSCANHNKIAEKYQKRFEIVPIFDPILNETKRVQEISELKFFAIQKRDEFIKKIITRAADMGVKLSEAKHSQDTVLWDLHRQYEESVEKVAQLDRDVNYEREVQHPEWEDPIPLKEELEPVAVFDVERMLPDILRPWIVDITERMQVPADFLAATCVVVLGSLIGRKVGIFPKAYDDWLVIPNLWGAVVGRPSLLKSPAIAEIMKPINKLAENAIQKHEEECQQYEQKEMWLEAQKLARKEEMKKAAAKGSAMLEMPQFERISKPILKRYKTEDATSQKIGEILLENPQGILIHRDELAGWLNSLDKYGHEGDRAFYLESWNGNGSFSVDRITRGTLHIPALCLSVIGGIQPGPLSSYIHQASMGGIGDDGLLQRFQVLVWPDTPKSWKNVDRVPNMNAVSKAFEVFKKLDAFEPFEPSLNEPFETYKLRFSFNAQKLCDEWRCSLEQRLRNGDLNPSLESHLAKYRSLMPSLALIFYLVETVGRGQKPVAVDIQSARQGMLWCEYLETHARRLYASGQDPFMDSARALIERIRRGDLSDGFTPRKVYHGKHWSKLDTPAKVTGGIKILEEFGWVKTEVFKTGGHPTTKVTLHPCLKEQK